MIQVIDTDSEDFTAEDAEAAIETSDDMDMAMKIASVGHAVQKFSRKRFMGAEYVVVSFQGVEKTLTYKIQWRSNHG